jgi:hypothetical protein
VHWKLSCCMWTDGHDPANSILPNSVNVPKCSITRPLQVKWCCSCCGTVKGPILENYLQQGTTVTAVLYNKILKSKLKPEMCSKLKGLLSKGHHLLHNMCLRILRQLLLKQSGSWNLNSSHIPYKVCCIRISCLIHKKTPWVDKDLSVMMKLRMQCVCGFNHNWELSLQMRWEGLWMAT